MSRRELTVGSTVGEALSFTADNLGAILRIGWFPLFLGTVVYGAIYYYFMGPIWMELIEAIRTGVEVAQPGQAGTPPTMEDDPVFQALMEMGSGKVTAFYSLSIFVSLLMYAIPSVAYARMVVTGEAPRGFFYFRLGGKEISLTIAYLAMFIAMYVSMICVMIVLLIPMIVGAGVMGAASGGEPNVAFFVLFLILFIPGILIGFAAPFAKLGLAVPVISMEGGLGLGESWDMTSGHFWTILWSLVLAGVLMVVVFMVAAFVGVVIAIPFLMAGAAAGEGTAFIAAIVTLGAFYVLFYFFTYCFSMALGTAVLSIAYRKLKDGQTQDEGPIGAEAQCLLN